MHFKNSMEVKTLSKIFRMCVCLVWKADTCACTHAECRSQTPVSSTLARLHWQMWWNRGYILVLLKSSDILLLNPVAADLALDAVNWRGPYALLQTTGSRISHNLQEPGSSWARPSDIKAVKRWVLSWAVFIIWLPAVQHLRKVEFVQKRWVLPLANELRA